jgi:hypothetical protein
MSLDISEPTVVVSFVRKRVVLPTAFPGRGNRIHHTLLDCFIVSIPMGLASLLMVDSDSSLLTEDKSMRSLTEQMSMRSLNEDGEGRSFGAVIVTSEDVADDEGGNASSESLESGRRVALTVWEGETMISVEGKTCWAL